MEALLERAKAAVWSAWVGLVLPRAQGEVREGRWCAARRLGDASEAASSTAKMASFSEVFFSMKDVLKS